MARHAARATYGRRARPTLSARTAAKSAWESHSDGGGSSSSAESELASDSSSSSSSEEEEEAPMRTRSSPVKKPPKCSALTKSTPAAAAARTPKRAALVEVQPGASGKGLAPNPRRLARTPKAGTASSSSSVIDSLAGLKGKSRAQPVKPALVAVQAPLAPRPLTPLAPPTSSSAPPSSPSPTQRRQKRTTPRRPQRSAAGAARKMLAAIGSEDTPSPPPKPSAYVGYGTTAEATAAAVAASEAARVKGKKRSDAAGAPSSGAASGSGRGRAKYGYGNRSRAKRQEEEEFEEEQEEEAVEAALIAQMGTALNLVDSSQPASKAPSSSSSQRASSSATPMQSLLCACEQTAPMPFAALLASLAASTAGKAKRWCKVGEASFSEVFGLAGRVLKIIPLRPQDPRLTQREEEDWPEESSVEDVGREVRLMRATQGLRGFVGLVSAHVVQGAYPVCLLKAWDSYDARKEEGSENVRPSCLPQSQLYTVLVLAHGGTDVEGVNLPGWVQAASVFWQVVDALARAEEACGFEHRDLHWGNVLVSLSPTTSAKPRTPKPILSPASPLRRRARLSASRPPASSSAARPSAGVVARLLDPEASGARATIIDLSLSRAVCEGQVLAYAFDEESIFEGEGDEQFDVYRDMRDLAGGAWQAHHPLTNIMWLAYLARKLLREKNLRRPGAPQRVVSGASLSGSGTGAASGSGTPSVSGAEVSAYNSLVRAEACTRAALAAGEEEREIGSAAHLLHWAL